MNILEKKTEKRKKEIKKINDQLQNIKTIMSKKDIIIDLIHYNFVSSLRN